MMSYLSGLTATDLPQGVEHRRDVGGGFRVGYHAPKGQIGLYDNKATLVAHVNIQTYPSEGLIVLHTGTDQGKIGGQGYLGMFFGEALRIIKRDFFYGYQTIQMTPALGAATKGLISQLARIRLNVIGGHGNKFSTARVFMAKPRACSWRRIFSKRPRCCASNARRRGAKSRPRNPGIPRRCWKPRGN